MYVTDDTVNSTADFDLFPLFNPIPLRDETFVFYIGGGRVARNTSASFVYQDAFVRCEGVASVLTSIWFRKRSIIIKFGRLSYGFALQGDAILTE